MSLKPSDLDLISTRADTVFALSDSGRILHKNNPEHEPGPRLYLSGCELGNVSRIGHQVDEETAEAIEALVATEPVLAEDGYLPVHLCDYLRLLAAEDHDPGLNWVFPSTVEFEHPTMLVESSTLEGDDLVAQIDDHGMPDSMSTLGFVDTDEFWKPWCVALDDDGQIASIAFTVGTGPTSAEVGVATVPESRGRGFAAAAVAGWARHPENEGRTLFYSTSQSNISSQRVTQRLGLRFLGASLTIM